MSKPTIRLLVTDLDGTVVGHRDDRQLYTEFKSLLSEMRREHRLLWVVYTGRPYKSFRSITHSMVQNGIYPDYVVTRYGELFKHVSRGYRFQPLYSARSVITSAWNHRRARRTLKRMHHHLSVSVRGVRRILRLPDRFVLRFADTESANDALRWIENEVRDIWALKCSLTGREVQVHQVTCRRANAVGILARRLGITPDHTLVIADSQSDRCMMDRTVAHHTGCPLNADMETKELVRDLEGHNSTQFTLAGVLDVMSATLQGSVSSVIPPDPENMPRRRRSHARHGSSSRSREGDKLRRSYILTTAIVCITVVVFASFGALPFSGLIMKPVYLVIRVLVWLADHIV